MVPDSDFKDPSLRDDKQFVVKVSLHSEDRFLFRLGSEDMVLLKETIINMVLQKHRHFLHCPN